MKTLLDLFETFAPRGSAVAMELRAFRTFRWSYTDLGRLCRATERMLAEKGVTKGDRVVIWAPNSPWWVVAYFGILLRSGIVVPVDFASDNPRARWIAEQGRAKFAFASRYKAGVDLGVATVMIEELEGRLGQQIEEHAFPPPARRDAPPHPRDSAVAETVLARVAEGSPTTDPHWKEASGDHTLSPQTLQEGEEVKENDVAVLIYTSGTTGQPKGVPLTHANLVANLQAVCAHIEVLSSDVFLSVLPLSHSFEMMAGCLIPLFVGARIVYLRTIKPSAILDAFSTGVITVFIAVPRLLAVLKGSIEQKFAHLHLGGVLRRLRKFARRMPSRQRKKLFTSIHRKIGAHFRYFVSGGAALDLETAHFWDDLGFTVIEGYGLTECAPVLTANQPDHSTLGTVGSTVRGVEIRIAPDGEIEARGPNIFSGYADNPHATKEAFTEDGWFKTGDVGGLKDGILTIKTRKKDVIVTAAGINVYPEDVEAVLGQVQGVKECAIIGIERGQGEQVHAVLVIEQGEEAARIIGEANRRLDSLQNIQDWTVWEGELPKTTTLKVKKQEVKERLMNGGSIPEGEGGKSDTVKAIMGAVLGRDPRTIDDRHRLVADLHVSSLDRADLLNRLELEYRRDLPDSLIGPSTTVADVARLVKEKHALPRLHLRRWTYREPVLRFRAQAQKILIYPAMRLLGSPVAVGREKLMQVKGPCILASNHVSYIDQSMILAVIPAARSARIATAARFAFFFEELGKTIFMKAWKRVSFEFCTIILGAFALHQGKHVQESLAFMGQLVDQGISILIFPEGERSWNGAMLPFQGGVGKLVQELRIPVVPVRCKHMEDIMPRGSKWARRGKAQILFGDPLHFTPGTSMQDIVRKVKEAIEALE